MHAVWAPCLTPRRTNDVAEVLEGRLLPTNTQHACATDRTRHPKSGGDPPRCLHTELAPMACLKTDFPASKKSRGVAQVPELIPYPV